MRAVVDLPGVMAEGKLIKVVPEVLLRDRVIGAVDPRFTSEKTPSTLLECMSVPRFTYSPALCLTLRYAGC